MYLSDDDGWDLLMNSNLCLKLVLYYNSQALLLEYLQVKLNFSPISPQNFDLRSLLWYFLSLWFEASGTSVTSSIKYDLSIASNTRLIC